MSLDQMTATWASRMLSVLRIVSGLLFLQHGTAKYFKFPYVKMFDGMQVWSLSGIGGLLELIGGVLLILGFYTRSVAFILSGEMAIAYWVFHAPKYWAPIVNGGELAALYCFVFLYLAFAGAGAWSVDNAMEKK